MKSITGLIGLLLIIGGILALAYQGFTYSTRENVAQIGDLKITADSQKTINLPPILGGLGIVAGIVLVVASRKL